MSLYDGHTINIIVDEKEFMDNEKIDEIAMKICGNFDAKVWAEQFAKMYMIKPLDNGVYSQTETEELMLGWFANAIMAGYDHARNRIEV